MKSYEQTRSMRSKVDELKMRGAQAVSAMRRGMTSGTAAMKANLRSNPRKWAGIAAGAGLGLGLMGRYLHRRSMMRDVPHLVIIEAC